MQHPKSIPEMQAEIRQLQQAMALPGIPPDELTIYKTTIARINAAINAQQNPVIPKSIKPKTTGIWKIPSSDAMEEAADRAIQEAQNRQSTPPPKPEAPHPPIGGAGGGFTATQTPITKRGAVPVEKTSTLHATLKADHNTNPYNPVITITWDDGYTFTGDETAIRGRLTSALRDAVALRHVQNRQYEKMWRWDTPWRAAGYLKALNYLNQPIPTALSDLGITRPTDLQRTIFGLIENVAYEKTTAPRRYFD